MTLEQELDLAVQAIDELIRRVKANREASVFRFHLQRAVTALEDANGYVAGDCVSPAPFAVDEEGLKIG